MQPIVIVVGTRPEGIKMMPVYFALKKAGMPVFLCSTAQHEQLLSEVFELFGVVPDISLEVMRPGQDLYYLTQAVLEKTKNLFQSIKPSLVLVHGDTTTAMAAALSAFYAQIPVGHVEAGLRTADVTTPFPEEMNRRFIDMVATYHFAPTATAAAHLLASGIAQERVFCTGNTVVDALLYVKQCIESGQLAVRDDIKQFVAHAKKNKRKIMLLTAHRRESFNGGIERILSAAKRFLRDNPEVVCCYPYHPNPQVMKAVAAVDFSSLYTSLLCSPLQYHDLVYVILNADVVLTDSGGIQEEAVSLGKPVLVAREETERAEGIWAGLAHLVGTDEKKIYTTLQSILAQSARHESVSVYGDGHAAQKIVTILQHAAQGNYRAAVVQKNVEQTTVTQESKERMMNKVSVVGLGYIGLPTAIVAASAGMDVVGYDVDQRRVDSINQGDPVIQEPALFERLQQALASKRFRATTTLESSDYFMIAVPTPFKEEHKADLSYVFSAAQAVAGVLKKGDVIILESTVPVGATQQMADYLSAATGLKAGNDFFVAHCPERVLPGNILRELVANDRIIGGINRESVDKAKLLYKKFVTGSLYLTDATTAEMVKLVENSSRDAQIAFAHQVASMSYAAGLNPYEVIELANKHPRVNILRPTCGVGGHCIAVDPWFLVESFPEQTALLKKVREVNDAKPYEVLAVLHDAIAQMNAAKGKKCTVALLGLTYKPNVDDLRESPSMLIAQEAIKFGAAEFVVVEPNVRTEQLPADVQAHHVSLEAAVQQADIILFLVAHKQFIALDEAVIAQKKCIDYCGAVHKPKRETEGQERLFWPASSAADFFVTNQPAGDFQPQQDDCKEHSL